MTPEILLVKAITLLFLESLLDKTTESSVDLIRTSISKIRENEINIGGPKERDVITGLKELVITMCNQGADYAYDKTDLLQQLRLIVGDKQSLYDAIEQGISADLTGPQLKRTITNIRKAISNNFREQKTTDIISKAFSDLRFNRHNILDFTAYIQNVISELGAASVKATSKDPAIVKSLDIGDETSVREVYESVFATNSGDLPFNTGWQELNEALQGGPRPGDCAVIGALQHNYKSGFSLSLFANIALFNKPKTKDPSKKPLIYRISFEDPITNNAQFLYQYLKYCETGEKVNIEDCTFEEMSSYVKEQLQVNGYHVLLDQVNPTEWTYMSIINRVIELESMGYAVEVLCVDYLSKVPTTGCTQGAMGDDVMDQLGRVRAFCSSNGILFCTPHQLSTEAKRLLQTVPADQFLNYIKGGGYFEKTRGLDRIYDIGILISKIEREGQDWLHVVIDKHRFPSVIDSRLKSFFLPFPQNKMPIRANYGMEDHKAIRKIPKFIATKDDEYFS